MSNSTFFETVNHILLLAGQQVVSDTGTFDDNAFLTKTQVQTKLFVDLSNREIIRKLRGRWLKREFTLSLSAYPGADNSYSLDAGTRLENVVDDSVFISDAVYGRKLQYIRYEEWKARFPQGETTPGVPMFWYDLPRTANSEADKIAFSPPTDRSLTVTYEGYERPVALINHSDEIAFEPDWEGVLWQFGLMWLEFSLAEGKMQSVQQFLDPMIAEIRQLTLGASAAPPCVDLGIRIRQIPRGRRSAYSPG